MRWKLQLETGQNGVLTVFSGSLLSFRQYDSLFDDKKTK